MPSTITTVTLDRLLEPRNPGASKSIAKPPPSRLTRRHSLAGNEQKHLPQLSPALYATPEVTPLPDSPTSTSGSYPPSPYIVNHKRRGPRLLKSVSQDDISLNERATPTTIEGGSTAGENGRDAHCTIVGSAQNVLPSAVVTAPTPIEEETGRNGSHDDDFVDSGLDGSLIRTQDYPKSVTFNLERDCEGEDFYDPQESMSFCSNNDAEDNSSGVERSLKSTTPMGEFYDAPDDLSSEGGPLAFLRDMEAELREIRLNLLTEIEKRKQAEETLDSMQKQWQRIREQFSLLGVTIPAASNIATEDENFDLTPGEELLQQIYIARMVSNSIGRGIARAEVEAEMESQIESKNFEIARLFDRLHYYETVNHEMSQRNQEAIGGSRQRQRRKRMSKYVWSSIGTAVAVGAVALAWSFFPTGRESSHSRPFQAPHSDDATKR